MTGRFLAGVFGPMLVATLLAAAVFSAPAVADDFPDVTLPDAVSCQDVSLVDLRGKAATVLVCLSIDCPISNEFMPTINRIAQAYRKRGVNFVGINPSGGQSLEQMADYARKHSLPFPFVKDAGGKVSRRLLYSVTPEARVFDEAGKLVYSGRIDDRYRRGGAADKDVAKDLENALEEVLAGESVSASRTKAIGCPIQIGDPRTGK